MKLSTKSRYGVRVLLDLALNGAESHVPLASVAERQEISARYLEQVAADLRKAGYIRSVKGAQGGYVLAQTPASIGIGELLRLLEGDIRLTDEPESEESRPEKCLRENLFDPLNGEVSAFLDGMTLQNLVDEQMRRSANAMYYI